MSQTHRYCTVVLATFNGAPYLSAQLDSLLTQTRQPDTLLVGDDGSTDGTRKILQAFQKRAPFPVTILLSSPLPLGPAGNFARLLQQVEGDWLALCDQDDVWYPEKLQQLEQALFETNKRLMAFSDADLVAANLRPLNKTLWQQVGLGEKTRAGFARGQAMAILLKRFHVMGAAMAFKTSLIPDLIPLPDGWPHDAWIASIAAAKGDIHAISTPLLAYRQHSANAVGGLRPPLTTRLWRGLRSDRLIYLQNEINRYQQLQERLSNHPSCQAPLPNIARQLVSAKLAHLVRRANLPDFPLYRWPSVFKDWQQGEYHRWTTDWRSLLLDLLMPNHIRPLP